MSEVEKWKSGKVCQCAGFLALDSVEDFPRAGNRVP